MAIPPPAHIPTSPVAANCQNLHPAIIIIIQHVIIITIDVLTCGSNNNNNITGAKSTTWNTSPLKYFPNVSLFLTKIPA